jgi:chemotaxis protein methyltransferase CheR
MSQRPAPRARVLPSREVDDIELDALLHALHARYGYDFRGYSRTSLQRRVQQAVAALGFAHISELQGRVLRDEGLVLWLISRLAISVTEMFRDPEVYAALRTKVLSYLRTYPSLKLWVAGCSTGEEVRSLCILLREEGLLDRTLIYATDINPANLEKARLGVYRREAVAGYARNYVQAGGRGSLSDYFTADHDAVWFDPGLVENVVFAEHNLATDAVFSEVHLVTCRNVLIYFDQPLQDRALGLFVEALCPGGFLCLGDHETISHNRHRGSFKAIAREHLIYQKC